jgi:adenylate cyclase, class 2
MAGHRENEIKFRVSNHTQIKRLLRLAGFRQITPRTHEWNTLYDWPGQKLRKRGELLRLRKYGERWLLTHKAKAWNGKHKSRTETETALVDGPGMELILRALGFRPTFHYEKFRAEWTDGKGYVVLDQTPIGDFGEIEGPPRWLDRTAAQLGIESADYITLSYAPMFLDWKKKNRSSAQNMTFVETRNTSSRKRPIRG